MVGKMFGGPSTSSSKGDADGGSTAVEVDVDMYARLRRGGDLQPE